MRVLPGTDPVGVGPVAQRIRARGYEPRCRGFESLLAHNRPKREGPLPWNGPTFSFYLSWIITYSNRGRNQHICVLLPVSARLGQNSRASTSISNIAKMRSSSLIRINQISPSRIRTYDQSVNSRPLYH